MSVPDRYRRRDPKTGQRIYPPMPDVYMPAMFPLDLARAVADRLRRWSRRLAVSRQECRTEAVGDDRHGDSSSNP